MVANKTVTYGCRRISLGVILLLCFFSRIIILCFPWDHDLSNLRCLARRGKKMAETGCEESLSNTQCGFIQPSRASVQDRKTEAGKW